MNTFSIATALIVATLPVAAVAAETDTTSQLGEYAAITDPPRELGEHPAVLVARTWSKRDYEEATKLGSHPALPKAVAVRPTEPDFVLGAPNIAATQEPQSVH